MADLSNINTANVGIIAFWNAEDHKTAGVVDPLDCTGVFDSYDVYDNGLDGVIALGSGRNLNCRVKNDGWCVAWIDRTNTFGYPDKVAADFGESGYKGYYDILWNWFNHTFNTPISSTLTTLSYIISLFEAALETSGDFTFSAGDVGHYCYEFTSANVLTLLGDGGLEGPRHAYIQYTAGTTLYHICLAGSSFTSGPPGYPANRILKFSGPIGNTLIDNNVAGYNYASADVLSSNWMPDPLTDYDMYRNGPYQAAPVNAAMLVIWS